jgi:raffinose/stachyose/melibiose transport system permease protein
MNVAQSAITFGQTKRKMTGQATISYIIGTVICIVVFMPLLITIFAAFKAPEQLGLDFPLMPPLHLYLANFQKVFNDGNLLISFKNSFFLAGMSIIFNAFMGSMVAYCLNRFDFRLKKFVFGLFFLGMLIPAYVTEIARFGIIKNLGLYNTIFAPIIIYAATDLLQVYIFLQFIQKIPLSLDESAMLDGCTYFGIFWRIIFPLLLPATATLAIIKAVDVLNDMYIPYLYMPGSELRTMTTMLMAYSSSMYGSWSFLSAAILIIMLPTLLIYLVFQKYIFAGIIAGAIKE